MITTTIYIIYWNIRNRKEKLFFKIAIIRYLKIFKRRFVCLSTRKENEVFNKIVINLLKTSPTKEAPLYKFVNEKDFVCGKNTQI